MQSHPVRRAIIVAAIVVAIALGGLPTTAGAHPHGPTERVFLFSGGGWGHGMGMSQHGAYGWAKAGYDHAEILAFYYDGTDLVTDANLVADDVDVLIGVHHTTVFEPSGMLTVSVDGQFLDTTLNTLTVHRGDGGWHINSSNIDWCRGFCSGNRLTVNFTEGEVVGVSGTPNGRQRYAYGEFQLTPAAADPAGRCGASRAHQYCLVIGDMTMQQYLYGIDEIPALWPLEAHKAQVIAARTFATAQIVDRAGWSSPFDLFSSTADQRYSGWDHESEVLEYATFHEAVASTADTVLVHYDTDDGEPEAIFAYYSSSNGGYTASHEDIRGTVVNYLTSKPDPYDYAPNEEGVPRNPVHSWQRTYSSEQVSNWLRDYTLADLDVGEILEIQISGVSASGRINNALVTLVGSERILEVRDNDGDPFGYRFHFAILQGCNATPGCELPLSTRVSVAGALPQEQYTADSLPFGDVEADATFAPAVAWLLNAEITAGTSETTFSPHKMLTRAEFATLLWRFAGRPHSRDDSRLFADVARDSFADEAIGWMARQNITNGCGTATDMRFCGDEPITTAHIAAFLWRYAGQPPASLTAAFVDVAPNAYFAHPAYWMIEHGLWVDDFLNPVDAGGDTTLFNPDSSLTRARMAMFLWQLAGTLEAFDPDAPRPPLTRPRMQPTADDASDPDDTDQGDAAGSDDTTNLSDQ